MSFTATNLGTDSGTSGDGDGDGDGAPGDGDGATGDGDGAPPDPPSVLETSPAPGSVGVDPDSPITVTFSEAMDPVSISSNGGADTCSGGVQVSDDGFATCIPLAAEVGAAAGDTVFTLTPLMPLPSRRELHVRVAAFASSANGVELGAPFETAEPFVTRYHHTIAIDGDNDFDGSDETFATTSPGFTAYVAWDRDYVYLGMDGPDIGSNNPELFLLAYVGGTPGSMTGVTYAGQQPTLPFAARWHPRWKSDGSYTNMQEFGGGWADAAGQWLIPNDYAHTGSFVEMRLARTQLELGAALELVMALVRETSNNQATYAGLPGDAFVDGFDPDFGRHYEFELDASVLPSEHSPL